MFVLRLAMILIVVLSILYFQPQPSRTAISSGPEFSVEEALSDFPPGATVLFNVDAGIAKDIQVDDVFLKRIDAAAGQTVWTVPIQRPTQTEIGFVVPQLPRGAYEAWCEPKNPAVKIASIKFTIAPHFLAEDGIVRSLPGKEVEVRVRIPIPKVSIKGGGSTDVNVSAKLTSRNPDIVQVVTDTPQKLDGDGAAKWKVRILKPGIAEVEAAAEGFEPAVMNVVGMPGPGATFLDAQLAVLRTQMRTEEAVAADADERSHDLLAAIEDRERNADVSRANEQDRKRMEKLKNKREVAATTAADAKRSSTEARMRMEELSSRQAPMVSEDDLKPGDVLLVLGSSPIISDAIRIFDGRQLNISAEYSHASLYVGKINETKMVAEMWSSGYWITPLRTSTKSARLVVVYRYFGIDDSKRDEIATRGKNIYGSPQNFISNSSPDRSSSSSPLPYAFEEIKLLSLAALGLPAGPIQTYVTRWVDPSAGGRRKMICSELVAWVYADAGLPLEVQYWRALTDAGIFSSNERRRDYTTPNMIALSGNLRRVGRFIAP